MPNFKPFAHVLGGGVCVFFLHLLGVCLYITILSCTRLVAVSASAHKTHVACHENIENHRESIGWWAIGGEVARI